MREMPSAMEGGAAGRIEIFPYPADPDAPSRPDWVGWAEEPAAEGGVKANPANATEAGLRGEFDRRLAEDTLRSFEAGRERGRVEGRQAEQEAQAAAQAASDERRVRQVAQLIEEFALERDRYLHAVEQEVVKLALAVAARILRREAQMDPLLLTGAVRVALGQLSGSTQVRLRVPESELDLWIEAIALLPNLAVKPTVVAGAGMRLGDCRIETELGTVDLGIRAQLGEIERGFFDRAGGGRAERAAALDTARSGSAEGRP
jgi:flagellar assembly protein FliH